MVSPTARSSYRADVLGSLLRPTYLLEAREQRDANRITAAEFKVIEDRAVDEAIALQVAAGVDVVTDGEMRRINYFGSISEAVEGVTKTNSPSVTMKWYGTEGRQDFEFGFGYGVTDRLKLRRSVVTEEFAYARSRTTKPVKVTLPSPMTLTLLWHPEHTPAVYPDPFEFYEDLAEITRAEIDALAALGCRYIQIDAADLAKLVDDEGRSFYESIGAPAERILTDGVDLLNRIVSGYRDVTFGIHLCRGNKAGYFRSAGGYEAISAQVFRRATAFDVFLLEYDDERSGGFEPLKDLPGDKVAVLGMVSTKRAQLEDTDTLLSRIDAASQFHPRENLAVSTQCGFGGDAIGERMTEPEEQAKLALVAKIAARAWGK